MLLKGLFLSKQPLFGHRCGVLRAAWKPRDRVSNRPGVSSFGSVDRLWVSQWLTGGHVDPGRPRVASAGLGLDPSRERVVCCVWAKFGWWRWRGRGGFVPSSPGGQVDPSLFTRPT